MLDIDFMTEQEIIEITHNPEELNEIINGNVIGIHKGEEKRLELSNLIERISPKHQDNDPILSIPLISKLLKKHLEKTIKKIPKNHPDNNNLLFQEVYIPLINLINKLSIKRACELVSNDSIKKIIFNDQIDLSIIYNAIIGIKKPSALKIMLETVNKELTIAKKNKAAFQEIKNALNQALIKTEEYSPSRSYFYQQIQSIIAQEKNNAEKIMYYTSLKNMINNSLSQNIQKIDEIKEERAKQESVEIYEKYLKGSISPITRR